MKKITRFGFFLPFWTFAPAWYFQPKSWFTRLEGQFSSLSYRLLWDPYQAGSRIHGDGVMRRMIWSWVIWTHSRWHSGRMIVAWSGRKGRKSRRCGRRETGAHKPIVLATADGLPRMWICHEGPSVCDVTCGGVAVGLHPRSHHHLSENTGVKFLFFRQKNTLVKNQPDMWHTVFSRGKRVKNHAENGQ